MITRRFRRYLEEREETGELDVLGDPEQDPEENAAERDAAMRQRKFAYPPNLVVVDGGPAQADAASRALTELGIDDVAVCGLAKRLEEVWLPGEEFPVILPRSSEGLYLLQRVRDEAHRFAITYHRQKRSRGLTASALDSVPGLGPTRRAALLKQFGSVKRLAAATPEEIATVPGIGPRLAGTIVAALHQGGHGTRGSGDHAGGAVNPVREHTGMTGPDDQAAPDLVIITGMSGAGRSTAAKSLEDLGWFVVDNLPPGLLPTMVDLAERSNGAVPKIAAVIDVRSRAFTTDLKSAIGDLSARGVAPRMLFLEACDDTLVRRFDSVRRPHPLQASGRIVDGIAAERELLRDVRGDADLVVDTSRLNVHELRGRMRDLRRSLGEGAAVDRGVVRLQVRPAGRRRPGGGLPVPAQPVLDSRAGDR